MRNRTVWGNTLQWDIQRNAKGTILKGAILKGAIFKGAILKGATRYPYSKYSTDAIFISSALLCQMPW
jgi:uncharacterized protein YjbI with pentapeptide repeats